MLRYVRVVRVIVAAEKLHDSLHVGMCLGIWWYAPIAIHCAFSRVVSGRHKGDVALKVREKPAQICQASAHVLYGIERLRYLEPRSRLRDQLHQALRILLGA